MSIMLGTPITYTHEAAVARIPAGREQWELPTKGNGEIPRMQRHGDGYIVMRVTPKIENIPVEHHEFTPSRYAPKDQETLLAKINKSVMVWAWPGSGVVTGLVSKQIGRSEGGSGYDEDYVQGWLLQYGSVKLYVVRHELKGQKFVYVPLWAAAPMHAQVVA